MQVLCCVLSFFFSSPEDKAHPSLMCFSVSVSVVTPESIYYRYFFHLKAPIVQRDLASPLQASPYDVCFCWPCLCTYVL